MKGGGLSLAAYCSGLLLGAWVEPPALIYLLPLAPLLVGWPLFFWRSLRPHALLVLPAISLILLGIVQYQLFITPSSADHLLLERTGQEIVVEGVVTNVEIRHDGRVRCDLTVSRCFAARWMQELEGVVVRLHIWDNPPLLRVGQTLRTTAKLRSPRNFGTPGEFDYVRYLARRDIFVTGSVANGDAVAVLSEPPKSGLSFIARWRELTAARVDSALPQPVAALTRALVLGDRGQVTPQEQELLARSGVAHLFAVSGLHLGLVSGWLYVLLLFFWRRSTYLLQMAPPRRYLPVAMIPLLGIYLMLAGSGMSLQRAFLMFSGAALLLAMYRRTAPLQLLITAVLLLLLIDPLALFEPSLQLSVAGVAGIVVAIPRWRSRFSCRLKLVRLMTDLALVTLAATLATAPVVLWQFHQLSFLGILANLVAVPLIGGVAIPLALIGVLAVPVTPALAAVAFTGCGVMLTAMLVIVEGLLNIFPAGAFSCQVAAWQVVLVAIFCWGWFLPARLRIKGMVAGLLIAAVLYANPILPDRDLNLTAFSVGQGESLLLSLPDGKHYLIDGGGLYGDTFDVGERLLAPALGRLGVQKLSAVILTHNHPDHYKGLFYILENFPVEEFWHSSVTSQLPQGLAEILKEKNIPRRIFDSGWDWLMAHQDLRFAIWGPPFVAEDENDHSLVVYASFGDDGVLLTGDLGSSGVTALMQGGVDGPVTLLKLPHHGSRYSRPLDLISVLSPQMVFASAGFGNRYGLPHPEIVRAVAERGLPLYQTDQHGTMIFSSQGRRWQVKYSKKQAFY